VFANSVENTTIAGTDYNLCPVGLLDASTSTSVHGLSGSSVANWNPALTSVTAGRFSGLKLRKARRRSEPRQREAGSRHLVERA
jgi:hypothetical protein